MPVIRSASLEGFADLVVALGGDPRRFARAAKLPVSALHSREVLVSAEAVGHVMELASDGLACPDFGLQMSALQTIDGLGPLAIALRHSATLRDAFETARRFLRLHNQGSTLSIEPDPYGVRGVVGLRHIWSLGTSGYTQVLDRGMSNLHRVVILLAGEDYGLRSVELAHLPRLPIATFQDYFGGVRVNVNRPQAMLRLPEALLARRIDEADETLRALAMSHLAQQQPSDDLVETARARAAVEALLGGGRVTVADVAQALELTPRTLQRRLSEEGVTFGAVVDQARERRALELLSQPQFSIADVAAMVGVDQATLARSARRWWAMTATDKQRQLRQ